MTLPPHRHMDLDLVDWRGVCWGSLDGWRQAAWPQPGQCLVGWLDGSLLLECLRDALEYPRGGFFQIFKY